MTINVARAIKEVIAAVLILLATLGTAAALNGASTIHYVHYGPASDNFGIMGSGYTAVSQYTPGYSSSGFVYDYGDMWGGYSTRDSSAGFGYSQQYGLSYVTVDNDAFRANIYRSPNYNYDGGTVYGYSGVTSFGSRRVADSFPAAYYGSSTRSGYGSSWYGYGSGRTTYGYSPYGNSLYTR